MVPTRPRPIYQAVIRRKPYFRRFAWSVLAAVAGVGALVALDEAAGRRVADRTILQVGGAVAAVIVIYFGLRALVNLWRWLTRRDEAVRFFDQGFSWTRGGDQYKAVWSKLDYYREGARGLYLGKRPIVQWGANRLHMRDGRVFKVTGAHGDMRVFARAVRKYTADVTGTWMARALRQEKPIRLHRQLILYPGGVRAGKHEIPWAELEVGLKRGRLVIYRAGKSGKFNAVKSYSAGSVDNVAGFLELVHGTLRNWQRERFEKRESQEFMLR
jgi:hypothetical protein